jgi:predicted unusual protein kinase regulating ubiquinone biosynthesis (AarF/ABC1/UbiB family)
MSQATVVRDLLSAGGVVAVKLGQMLAEDPNVPADYRRLLGSLRDR